METTGSMALGLLVLTLVEPVAAQAEPVEPPRTEPSGLKGTKGSESVTHDDATRAPASDPTDTEDVAPADGATESAASDGSVVADQPSEQATVVAPLRPAGERGDGGTASKFDLPRDQLGSSISIVGSAVMKERGLFDVNSALQLVPGVTPVWEYGGFQFMTIRGFEEYTILDDFRRDDRNTFVTSAPLSGLWDVERIEVLRGPASASFGYSTIGGVVNIVRKRPTAADSSSFFSQYGGPEQYRFHMGVNRAYLDKRLLVRADAGTEYRSDLRGATTRRTGGSLAVSLFPGAAHSLSMRLSASSDHYNTDTGLPTVNGAVPEGIALERRFNTPQDGMDYTRVSFDLDYEGRLAPALQLVDRFRVALDDYRYFSTELLSVASDNASVNREYFYLERHWKPLFNQAELVSRQELGGGVSNRALIGYETSLMASNHPRSRVWAIPVASVPLAGGNRPDPQPAVDFRRDAEDQMTQVAHGLYAQDRLSLPAGFALDGSVRLDSWQRTRRRDNWDPATETAIEQGVPGNFATTALTGRGAVVYKPNEVSSSYVSIANAFRPNEIVGADGRSFEPQRGLQVELGQSLTFGRHAAAHASAYWIQKSNVVVPLGQDRFDQAGGIESRGGDLQLDLTMGRWLSGTIGYALTDAQFTNYRTDAGVDLSGKRPRISALHSGSFWLSSSPIEPLRISLGGRGQGDAFADNANTVLMPAYMTFDAALAWRRDNVTVGATVRNLSDVRRYFTSSINGSQLTPGPGRELLVNLQLDI